MGYDRLQRFLRRRDCGRIVTLPDGSVDRYCRVFDGRNNVLERREEFAAWVERRASDACRLREQTRTIGGQAVNTARQCSALGADVTLFGHLETPLAEELDVTAYSMGAPAEVTVLVFDAEEVMLSTESAAISNWTLADLDACPASSSAIRDADLLCVQNWVGVPNMDAALREFAGRDRSPMPVVFDPGDVTGSTRDAIEELATTMTQLGENHDLVVSVNEDEMYHLLDALDVGGSELPQRVERLRTELGLRGAVVHDVDRALAATPDGAVRVANFDAEQVRRRVGAGDRFNGGLAHVLSVRWDWKLALALGNTCATHYVETTDTGSTDALAAFLAERPAPTADAPD